MTLVMKYPPGAKGVLQAGDARKLRRQRNPLGRSRHDRYTAFQPKWETWLDAVAACCRPLGGARRPTCVGK